MSAIAAVDALPASGLTITALQTLDTAIPGAWSNQTSFDALAAEVAGSDSAGLVAAIRARAAQLEAADPRYGRALRAYTLVDTVDQVAAGAAVASKAANAAASMFGSLGFLEKFTPKPDTTQSIDAGLKLVAELLAFGMLNGVPTTSGPDGLVRFAGALEDYARYDLTRIAAWVVFDGLVPLGPDFVSTIVGTWRGMADDALSSNAAFDYIGPHLPGDSNADKQAFVVDALDTTGEWVTRFVADKQLTQQGVLDTIQSSLSLADGGLDYVAAALDASTTYFSHTGTQTVGRTLARHAIDALKEDAWNDYVASL